MRFFVLGILLMWLLGACDTNRIYEDYQAIAPVGWHKDSLARFQVEIGEKQNAYNLYINIRNQGNYPNSNIWLFLEIEQPNGILLTDTVEYVLAEKSGKWKGNGIGDLFDNQFVYRKHIRFEQEGSYNFRIRHGMRAEVLKGIHDVGLRIEKQNQSKSGEK